jgi:hypothetical protein
VELVMFWTLMSCAPILDDDTPYVTEPRVLAVRVAPAEVLADEEVTMTALYADPDGGLSSAPLDWSFCPVPKPLAELGPVAGTCLDPESPDLVPIGSGIEVTALVPTDVCSLFGPNPPPPREGQLAGRPADPDITGGFYQPVLVFPTDEGDPTLVSIRVRCGLANVTQETYIAWNLAYRSNENPSVATLRFGTTEVPPDGTGVPPVVAPGETVALTVEWPACADDAPCAGAEEYVVYDPPTGELQTRREAISATWFTTAGTYEVARNGRAGDDEERTVTNDWTAPETEGEAWIAVVLRDERGGVDFGSYRLEVR